MTDFTPDPFAAPTPGSGAVPPAPAGYPQVPSSPAGYPPVPPPPPGYAPVPAAPVGAAPVPAGYALPAYPGTPAPVGAPVGTYPPVPPVWGAAPQTVGPRALTTVIAVIAFAASIVLLQVFNVYAAQRSITEPAWGLLGVPVLLLWVAAGVFSYVSLSLWMMRIRELRQSRGLAVPATWRIWAGWFIPILSLFVPYQAMKELKEGLRGSPSSGVLTAWWMPWLLSLFLDRVAYSQGAVGAGLPGLAAITTVMVAVSTFALVRTIRGITTAMDSLLTTPPASTTAGIWQLR